MFNRISRQIYENNKQKGFDVKNENIGQSLMLIVTELSEALEADRKGKYANLKNFDKYVSELREEDSFGDQEFFTLFQAHIKDTFEDEITDSFIRLLDFIGAMQIDIDRHIEMKLKYNKLREYKHGKRY